jgi:hypothetical protein
MSRKYQVFSVHHRIPITDWGKTLRIKRTENLPSSLSPGYLVDALSFGNHLIRRLVVPSSRSSESALTRTVSRFRGSHNPSRVNRIDWLPGRTVSLSLGQLSQISGADLVVSSTSIHVRDRARPSNSIANSREHSFEWICTRRVCKY